MWFPDAFRRRAGTLAGALKLVAEAFPWAPGSCFAYTRDNHNSVLGIREDAMAAGACALAVDHVSCADGEPSCDSRVSVLWMREAPSGAGLLLSMPTSPGQGPLHPRGMGGLFHMLKSRPLNTRIHERCQPLAWPVSVSPCFQLLCRGFLDFRG